VLATVTDTMGTLIHDVVGTIAPVPGGGGAAGARDR